MEKEREYPKLVRDKIPQIIEEVKGKKIETRIIEGEEYKAYLLKKFQEESAELAETKDKEHLAEEIADILELIDSLLEFDGLKLEDIKKIQKEKAEKRGGFKEGILMLEEA